MYICMPITRKPRIISTIQQKRQSRNHPSFSMSAFNTVICIKPKRYAGGFFFRSTCNEDSFSVFLSPGHESSISVVFGNAIFAYKDKSWHQFRLQLFQKLKCQLIIAGTAPNHGHPITDRIWRPGKPQDSNELRSIWLSSSADFCSCQTDSKPKCCGQKQTSQVPSSIEPGDWRVWLWIWPRTAQLVRLWTFLPHRFLLYLKTLSGVWSHKDYCITRS